MRITKRIPFILPAHRRKVRWEVALDTYRSEQCQARSRDPCAAAKPTSSTARSLAMLRLPKHVEGEEENGDGHPGIATRAARAHGAKGVAMKIPATTYRLQFTPEFGFADADAVLAYLRELGITRYLRVADFSRALRQPARLRRRRSQPAQSRARQRRGVRQR